MKFKEGVAYIVTKDTIGTFIKDVEQTDIIMYDDIKEVKYDFKTYINSLDYVILFIENNQVWYDTTFSDIHTVDEITPELLRKYSRLNEKAIYRSKKILI